MSDETSPRPWSSCSIGRTYWISAASLYVGLTHTQADAALIVAAVNERDALRALVRLLSDRLEHYHIVGKQDHALIREAHKLLGENKQ